MDFFVYRVCYWIRFNIRISCVHKSRFRARLFQAIPLRNWFGMQYKTGITNWNCMFFWRKKWIKIAFRCCLDLSDPNQMNHINQMQSSWRTVMTLILTWHWCSTILIQNDWLMSTEFSLYIFNPKWCRTFLLFWDLFHSFMSTFNSRLKDAHFIPPVYFFFSTTTQSSWTLFNTSLHTAAAHS